MQTFGRGYLQHQQIFAQGCDRHFRRRLHGEIVSPDGLLFTNHHCGYGSIQSLSSVEHDYLKNGFWAMSRQEEIPAPGLKVRFIRSISDVTADILGNVPSTAGQQEYERITSENIAGPDRFAAGGQPRHDGGGQAFLRREPVFSPS